MATSGQSDVVIENRKRINLIFVDFQGSIIYTSNIDNSDYKFKNIDDVRDYIENNEEYKKRDYIIERIDLAKNYLKYLIPSYSIKYNKGFIDWRYEYNNISFKKDNNLICNLPITIKITFLPYGIGSALGNATFILKLISKLKNLFSFLKNIPTKKRAYEFFLENYDYDEEFINSVITQKCVWRKGFIDSNIYDNKLKYERKIMKSLNYKYDKKEKLWER